MDIDPVQLRFIRNLTKLPNTNQSSNRLSLVRALRSDLPAIYGEDKAKLATLTAHTLSQLFTIEQLDKPQVTAWSRLPSISEPLLEQLLSFLCENLGHQYSPDISHHIEETGTIPSLAGVLLTEDEKQQIAFLPDRSHSLYPSHVTASLSFQSLLRAAFSAVPRHFQLSTAHLLQILSTIATEKSVSISRAALHAQSALCRAIDPSVVASFLPGLVSAYSKLLSKCATLNSTVVIACLDALHCVLYCAFPQLETTDRKRRTVLELCADTADSESQGPNSTTNQHQLNQTREKPRLKADRDDVWIKQASAEISLRLFHVFKSHDGPLKHSSPQVLAFLCRFVANILRQDSGILLAGQVALLLRTICVFLCGDEFSIVRVAARGSVKMLFGSGAIEQWELERGIRALVRFRGYHDDRWELSADEQFANGNHSGPGLLQAAVDMEDSVVKTIASSGDNAWIRLGRGYLSVILPTHLEIRDELPKQDFILSPKNLPQLMNRIGPSVVCRLLLELHKEVFSLLGDTDESICMAMDNIVLRTSFLLGKCGLLPAIFSTLIAEAMIPDDQAEKIFTVTEDSSFYRHLSSFKYRAFVVLILHGLLRGAVAEKDMTMTQKAVHNGNLYQCTKEIMESMNYFFVPTLDRLMATDLPARVDDEMISLKRCLLFSCAQVFEEVGALFRRTNWRPLGADLILVVLMGILLDVSDGEECIRDLSRATFLRIAKATGSRSERQLLFRHLNFCIGRVVKNLDAPWAGNVLSFIIGKDGDEVSRESTVLLSLTLRQMNDTLAARRDESVRKMLASIDNVLSAAVLQKQGDQLSATAEDNEFKQREADRIERIRIGNEKVMLRKTLLSFCTDEVVDYDQLTKVAELDESYGDLSFPDSEDESEGDVFETIALHTLAGTRDVLFGRPWNVRASALRCATLSVRLLDGKWKALLPHAAKVLPLLPDQFLILNEQLTAGDRMLRSFKERQLAGREDSSEVADLVAFLNNKGKELPVVTNACLLLSAFAKYAGSFIQDRFVRLIYPKLRSLLRLAHYYPTLLVPQRGKSGVTDNVPSYGAMAAADACLEALAAVATVAPKVLSPHTASLMEYICSFFDARNHPENSPKKHVVYANRSMVRFEIERWERRRGFAETVVRGLQKVNRTEVIIGLLKSDESASQVELAPPHESLHSLIIKSGGGLR